MTKSIKIDITLEELQLLIKCIESSILYEEEAIAAFNLRDRLRKVLEGI